jgi:hypothetical protein
MKCLSTADQWGTKVMHGVFTQKTASVKLKRFFLTLKN